MSKDKEMEKIKKKQREIYHKNLLGNNIMMDPKTSVGGHIIVVDRPVRKIG